jgi:uncharacterized protein (DUF697 family)
MSINTEKSELIEELSNNLKRSEKRLQDSIKSRVDIAHTLVNTNVAAGMSIGLLPMPLFDIASIMGVQVNMLRSLCIHYDISFNEKLGKSLLASLAKGVWPVLTVMSVSSIAKGFLGVGTLLGGAGVSTSAGALVYASGQVFIRHFEAGGTLDDFESKQSMEYFKYKFKEGKVRVFVEKHYKKSKSAVKNILKEGNK